MQKKWLISAGVVVVVAFGGWFGYKKVYCHYALDNAVDTVLKNESISTSIDFKHYSLNKEFPNIPYSNLIVNIKADEFSQLDVSKKRKIMAELYQSINEQANFKYMDGSYFVDAIQIDQDRFDSLGFNNDEAPNNSSGKSDKGYDPYVIEMYNEAQRMQQSGK